MMFITILAVSNPLFQCSVQAGWVVAPDGDKADRPLSYIPRDPNIPSRAPVGYPCESDVIEKIGNTRTAWVYMRDGYDLAAVCIFDEPAPQPPVVTRTFSQTYGLPAPDDVTGIVSYIQYTTDGTTWGAWTATQSSLTGCIRYSVPDAIAYQTQTAYVNSIGEGPKSAIVQIAVTVGQPVC